MPKKPTTQEQLLLELEDLRARLDEAKETLRAIRSSEVDALVVTSEGSEQVFTLKGADHSYRILIEEMNDGALTVTAEGLILYANRCFAKMLKTPLEKVIGTTIYTWIAPIYQNILQSMLTKGANEKSRYQLAFTTGDGTQVPVNLSVSSLPTNEEFDSFCLVATDLTEQKRIDAIVASEKSAKDLLEAAEKSRLDLLSVIEDQELAEQALRESEQKYRSLTENLVECIYRADPETFVTLYINHAVENLYGYSVDEWLKDPSLWENAIHPDYRERVFANFLEAQRTGKSMKMEYRIIRKDGELRWVEDHSSWTKNSQGKLTSLNGIMYNITKRKQAEETLRESEERYRIVFERAGDYVLMLDVEQGDIPVIMDANETALATHGYERDEIIGKPISLFDKEMTPEVLLERKRLIDANGSGVFTARHFRKDGTVFDVEVSIQLVQIGNKHVLLSIERDITERKRAEEALSKSEAQLSNALQIAHLGPWEYDVINDLFTFNDLFYAIFRTTAGQVGGYTMSSADYAKRFVHPEDVAVVGEEVRKAIETDDPNFSSQLEHRIIYADGEVGYITVRFFIIKDETGRTIRTYGVNQDITERKQTEENLQKSEERSSGIIESIPDFMSIIDEDYNIVWANEVALNSFGKEITEKKCYEAYHHINKPCECCIVREVFMDGKVHSHEAKTVDKDGNTIHQSSIASVVSSYPDGRPSSVIEVSRNITEQKQLEDQFRQSQKMEAVGRLTGGIAHDFNNLLTVISGHTEMAMTKLDAQDPLQNDLQEVQKAAVRAADLTRQLLAYSRKQTLQPKVLDLNNVITNLDKMLRRLISEDIILETIPREELWRVEADPGQIEQVIINLVVNARDAMPDGGKLVIETQNVELDEEYTNNHVGVTPGSYVMLAVSDTGCGMTDEIRVQIFDPFFSTKEEGKGTGLGLSTVYGIVKQSGGHIWVYSEPGKGTTFKIYLPMVREEAEEFVHRAEVGEAPSGTETVLVVEDEQSVRLLASRILKMQGYNVLEAQNGGEAYLMCEKMEKPVDLVVTDVIMPVMSGAELIKKLREIWTDFKVLFMSGYTSNAIVHSGVLDSDTPYLQKPFRPVDLAWKVREVLDSQK